MSTTETQNPLGQLIDYSWKALVLLGAASAVLGVLAIVWPGVTTVAVAVLFGIYLLLSGIAQLAIGFGGHLAGSTRALLIISGGLSLILGLVCFRDGLQSVELLGLWVGIGWIMAGVGALFDLDVPGMPAGLRLLESLLLIVGGAILLASPIESIATLVWVAGIMLVIIGVTQIVHGLQLRKLHRRVGSRIA